MTRKLLLQIRDPGCTDCKLHRDVDEVCELGFVHAVDANVDIMVVGKMPNSKTYQESLEADLESVGLDTTRIYFTSTVKCRQFDLNVSNPDVKACSKYLQQEIDIVKPKWVLAMGNEALLALTGHSGITKYRSRVFDRGEYSVIPTISPAAALRNPGQRSGWLADLRFFVAQVYEKSARVAAPDIHYINTKEKFEWLKKLLAKTELIAYDVETFSTPDGDEFADDAAIISLAGTCVTRKGKVVVWALPLFHPGSPFRHMWERVLEILKPFLEPIKKQVAHNGKYDARWMRQFGVRTRVTYDTMLAAHILDENRPKGLKAQATSRFGVAPWGVDTRQLINMPIMEVLEYNALDTYYTYHVYLETRDELFSQPRLLRVFRLITTPANEILVDVERHGVWVDRERLQTEAKRTLDMRDAVDDELMQWVPDHWSDEKKIRKGWPQKGRKKVPVAAPVNFNPSNFARWLLFEHLKLPVLERGKDKNDGSPGDPSMRESVMMELRDHHPIARVMLERARLQKMSTFYAAYQNIIDEEDRIRTTFKLAGTVTGRLSSGKADEDKIPGARNIRGANLQQVPRDPLVRGLFGATDPYVFVEADFSQVELRVVAFIARERRMMHLYQTGQDIHRATAANTLGVPVDKVTKDDRKKAKAVNFGFVYGMGWRKFIATAFEKYELHFSEKEAQDIRKAFFVQFPGLLPWHARQRRLVNDHQRVVSPLGRIRHLPDILSGEGGVRGEAERQAINSPVQAFASDMTQISMILIHQHFKDTGIKGHILGSVHDALLFEIHRKHVRKALPVIKDTMENLPLRRMFGLHLDVPIVADLKLGSHWGDARELEPPEVYNYRGEVV
jgi:uracil-DNA glycosylase family 4